LGSKSKDFLKTFLHLGEILPFGKKFQGETRRMEEERQKIESAWIEGRRGEVVQLGEQSQLVSTRMIVDQILQRASNDVIENRFLTLCHKVSDDREGAIHNWELMSRLGPSFGIVGTITGMVQMFKTFGTGGNVGTTLSLALLATLYGIVFGAGVASPIMNFLQKIYHDRLNVIDRCQTTVKQLKTMG
jgi:chemotaxis protein MotA